MSARPGVVYLVGAGPGDPGLLTARALELIADADVILHDRLIPTGALDGAVNASELIYVGKRPGEPSVEQGEIERLLIEHARAGRRVVRLKGGDPFTFGRGGEEAEALAEAGIPFEVVPGVTAGIAATAYAGIPVTHREQASAVAFVTGHEDPGKPESAIDWEALARFPGTLVFYMGVKRLGEIASALIAAGRDGAEPAAVIERGTLPAQRTASAPLAELAAAAEREQIRPPAITVVGEVAALRERIAWLENRPLHGKRVLVTRARAQASGLAKELADLGAEVIELPAIRIEPRLDDPAVHQAIGRIKEYELICLTSPNAVELFFDALAAMGHDARALAGARIAAIGRSTAAALYGQGIDADILPETAVGESLVEALAEVDVEGKAVLVARAVEGRDLVPNALRERGAEVDEVAFYETVAELPAPEALGRVEDADYVTFTSASTVRNLVAAIGTDAIAAARVVSIGPITSEAAREAGLEVHVEAEHHDIDGLLAALVADAELPADG